MNHASQRWSSSETSSPGRVETLRRIDAVCLAFEENLRSGNYPTIRLLLEGFDGTDRAELLRELLLLEWDYRREIDAVARLNAYLDEFPSDSATIRDAYAQHCASGLPPDSLTGRRFGDYELLSPLGQGGMATVYLALHLPMQRKVALKVIRGEYSTTQAIAKRFRREIEATARLTHPKIITAFDAGEQHGVPYLVTEYVDGTDLSHLVKRDGRLPWQVAVDYVLQAADALCYAHEQGVVHRDVKPSNLLVDDQGSVKLLDLGLARILEDTTSGNQIEARSQLTECGTIVGTVDYMAPEQAQHPSYADHRADIYGLGCTLYFLVTGAPLFFGETSFARMLAHRDNVPPQLSNIVSGVPKELDQLFARMVAKDPAVRPTNMRELIDALKRIVANSHNSETAGVTPWLRTRSAWLMSVAVATATVLFLTCGLELLPRRSNVRAVISSTTHGASKTGPETPQTLVRVDAPCEGIRASELQQELAKQLHLPILWHNSVDMPFCLIPSGTFHMGQNSTTYRTGWREMVSNRAGGLVAYPPAPHAVQITCPFYLASTETTVAQFRQYVQEAHPTLDSDRHGAWGEENGKWIHRKFYSWQNMGDRPVSDDHPVSNVSWQDTQGFCDWLAHKSGGKQRYRLPTEAEWEFACRAGSNTHWWFGDDKSRLGEFSWFVDNAEGGLHAVATRTANPFGLFDMHGSKQEWCFDWFEPIKRDRAVDPTGPTEGTHRTRRGGGVLTHVMATTSGARGFAPPHDPSGGGFRVLLEIDLPDELRPTSDQ